MDCRRPEATDHGVSDIPAQCGGYVWFCPRIPIFFSGIPVKEREWRIRPGVWWLRLDRSNKPPVAPVGPIGTLTPGPDLHGQSRRQARKSHKNAAMIKQFVVGTSYAHDEVYRSLAVGNAGGIRPARGKGGSLRRVVIMSSHPLARIAQENPYADRLEDETLVFTAAGRSGDQALSGINARLLQQLDGVLPIYAFVNTGHRRRSEANRWKFLGLVQYQRHFKEIQVDSRNDLRSTWVFEFRIAGGVASVAVDQDFALAGEIARETPFPATDDRQVLRPGLDGPSENRDEAIRIESTRRKLLGLSPVQFEGTIREVLALSGFADVTLTKSSGDGGIDVNARAGPALWPLGGLHLQVQAKRWMHSVGRREVAELRGSLETNARGLLVTTGFFTRAALSEAGTPARAPVVLVDGWEFSRHCLALKVADC